MKLLSTTREHHDGFGMVSVSAWRCENWKKDKRCQNHNQS